MFLPPLCVTCVADMVGVITTCVEVVADVIAIVADGIVTWGGMF